MVSNGRRDLGTTCQSLECLDAQHRVTVARAGLLEPHLARLVVTPADRYCDILDLAQSALVLETREYRLLGI